MMQVLSPRRDRLPSRRGSTPAQEPPYPPPLQSGPPGRGRMENMKRTSHPTTAPYLRPASEPPARRLDLPPAELNPFDYHPLTRVVFGPGALGRLGELTRELGGHRV